MRSCTFLLLLSPLLVKSFVPFLVPSATTSRAPQQTKLSALITETEAAKVLAKAKDCMDNECSVDAGEALPYLFFSCSRRFYSIFGSATINAT